MDEDRARYLDIEQMVIRELRDYGKGLCEWHSTQWPKIIEQQAILEICEVPQNKKLLVSLLLKVTAT